jgi:hypothetical protein
MPLLLHGRAGKFNDNLFNRIKVSYDRYVADEKTTGRKIKDKWNLAAQAIEF